jgi:benzoyl-CoA 2,3-epoxidase subunit A
MAVTVSETFTQHLIDPVICIHCNTCESTCPVNAISHDERNYVLDPDICDDCNACITPYPTGTIDNWRKVRRHGAYTTPEQLGWDELPGQDAELAEDPAPRGLKLHQARAESLAAQRLARL